MDLSIIIVNWNSADFLRKCLESIFRSTQGLSVEVIVVDNASFDSSAAMINDGFPCVRYIQSNENLGFARANNLGTEASTGRILFFLNPDTEMRGNALGEMVQAMDRLPQAGAVGALLFNADGTVQTSCIQSLPTIFNQAVDSEALRNRFPRSSLWGIAPLLDCLKTPQPVQMISGAALMVRRETFERVGHFTSSYFMYGEDADLCFKINQAGYRLFFIPTAEIVHYGGQSTKSKESSFSILAMQKSLALYFGNTSGKATATLFRLTRFLTACLRLGLLRLAQLGSSAGESRRELQPSINKWKLILRWSLGSEEAKRAFPPKVDENFDKNSKKGSTASAI